MWQPFSWLSYYAALSMKKLGDDVGGQKKLQDLLAFANERLNAVDEGGFFTSVPATVVFDEDPNINRQFWSYYLIGLAQMGLGNNIEARRAFESILALVPFVSFASFVVRF